MTRTALITGSARRIGAAIARRFAEGGYHAVIHFGHAEAEAEALAEALRAEGRQASCLKADLADHARLEAALAGLAARHPGWCVLVNNASIFDYDSAKAPSRPVWLRAEAVNLWPAVMMSKIFAEARKGQEGAIVNLLDQKLANLNPDFFSYTLSKAALETAGRMLALEHAPTLRVLGVAPGLTMRSSHQSELDYAQAAKRNLLERATQAADIAEAVYFAATGAVSSGQTLYVDGGERFLPLKRDVMFEVGGNL